jgi:hypothetical protein
MNRRADSTHGLLTIRTTIVLLLAILAAATAAVLTWLTRHEAAEAVLAGLGVLAGGIRFFDWLIT